MNDLDHMLNGEGSRRHHQEMIQQAQYARFTPSIEPAQAHRKNTASLQTVLAVLISKLINHSKRRFAHIAKDVV